MPLTQTPEDGLKISNAGSNGQYLQKQSGNTGGLTWATVSTDLVSDTSPQLGGDLDTNGFEINLDDNHKIKFGAGNDFAIYHDADASLNVIDATGHDLEIRHNAEKMITCADDGAVELYYDDVKTFNTITNGIQVRGTEGAAGEIFLYADEGDDYADLWKVKADYVASGFYIQNKANGSSWEDSIQCFGDGAVNLFHNNTKRFETTSGGAQVSGTLEVTSYISQNDSIWHYWGTGDDCGIMHDGSHMTIRNGTGNLRIEPKSGELGVRCIPDGSTEIYHDNTNTFQTAAHGATIHNVADPRLVIQGSGHPQLDLSTTGTTDNCSVNFGDSDDGDAGEILYAHTGNTMRFYTGGTERMRLSSDGLHLGGTGSDNALDDYEEGYWTPVLSGSVSGYQALNTSADQAAYTKVGRVVHIQARIQIGGSSIGAEGQIRISIPFTNASLNDEADLHQIALNTHGLSLAGDHQTSFGEFSNGSGMMYLVYQKDNASWQALTWSDAAVGDYIAFNGSYITSS